MAIQVDSFIFDEENEAKIAAHGLSLEAVDQILDSHYKVRKNRKGRRGLYLLIGTDYGGRCIAVPIEATQKERFWRPITAWPCKGDEATYLQSRG